MAKFKNIPKKQRIMKPIKQVDEIKDELDQDQQQTGTYRNRQMSASNKNPEGGKDGSTR